MDIYCHVLCLKMDVAARTTVVSKKDFLRESVNRTKAISYARLVSRTLGVSQVELILANNFNSGLCYPHIFLQSLIINTIQTSALWVWSDKLPEPMLLLLTSRFKMLIQTATSVSYFPVVRTLF